MDFAWLRKAVKKVDEIAHLVRRNIQKTIALDALVMELREGVCRTEPLVSLGSPAESALRLKRCSKLPCLEHKARQVPPHSYAGYGACGMRAFRNQPMPAQGQAAMYSAMVPARDCLSVFSQAGEVKTNRSRN